ncbi:hypothetical protein CEXT_401841 [Caerostris extrusa]|uniref:Uncharacterized protein n=1 Tax=Caerostris extrusa TaxID=172846 RepID=A0AAV4N4K1_CAEEX|nr:hypothetical protein CEXT_401841 [Caerostris extrusa]
MQTAFSCFASGHIQCLSFNNKVKLFFYLCQMRVGQCLFRVPSELCELHQDAKQTPSITKDLCQFRRQPSPQECHPERPNLCLPSAIACELIEDVMPFISKGALLSVYGVLHLPRQ